MKILGIERDKTACNFYRVLQPLSKLDEQGLAEVHMIREDQLGEERAKDMALWADVLVFQRPATESWFNFIKLCRKIGKVIVSDYDDDPFNTSPLNPYYQYVGTEEVSWQWPDGTKEWLWSEQMVSASGKRIFNIEKNIAHRDMFRLNFKKSDLVTCTTDILRDEFLTINPNVAVLPNVIDPAFFPQVPGISKGEVRIGWQGGASHYEDLYLVKDVVRDILAKNPSVKFVYFGDMRFQGLFKECNQAQIEWHPWVGHNVYPYKLALLNLDIGLCPLVDNRFNRNKSAIKWMEYSQMGIMTVASDIPPYAPVIKQYETGFLVNEQHSEWMDAVQEAIDNVELRRKVAARAKEDVYENNNADKKAHLWLEAYERAMKGSPVEVTK